MMHPSPLPIRLLVVLAEKICIFSQACLGEARGGSPPTSPFVCARLPCCEQSLGSGWQAPTFPPTSEHAAQTQISLTLATTSGADKPAMR